MASRSSKVQNSFTTGEVTSEMYGRTDVEQYDSGLSYCSNFTVSPRGMLLRRPPSYHFDLVWDAAETYRLVPFRIGNTLQRILVFSSDGTMRQINPYTKAWVGAPYSLSLGSGWNSANVIEGFTYSQINDTLFLDHPDVEPASILRIADTNWTFQTITVTDGPFDPINADPANTHTISNYTGFITVTAVAASFNAATDVGRWYRFLISPDDWVTGRITAVASSTSATVQVHDFGVDAPGFSYPQVSAVWRLGAWYTGSYPGHLTSFKGRLAHARTDLKLSNIAYTNTQGFAFDRQNFSPSTLTGNTISAAEGFAADLSSPDTGSPVIYWLLALENLYAGTSEGVYQISTLSGADAFGPETAEATLVTDIPVQEGVPPLKLKNNILVVEAGGRRALRLIANSVRPELQDSDITFFSNHLFKNRTITDTFRMRQPYDTLWLVTDDGKLLSILYNPTTDQAVEVVGIVQHTLGGTNSKVLQATDVFNSVTELPEAWFVVERTVNGATQQSIEYFDGRSSMTSDDTLVFCDNQEDVSFSGTAVTGLTRFAGESVAVNIDGADAGIHTVTTGGALTLPFTPDSSATVGLNYASEAWLLPTVDDNKSQIQESMLGRTMRLRRLDIYLIKSLVAEAGRVGLTDDSPTLNVGDTLKIQSSASDPLQRPTPKSGWFPFAVRGNTEDPFTVYGIRASNTYPCNIVAVRVNGEAYEET